jgi:hypothetical protein
MKRALNFLAVEFSLVLSILGTADALRPDAPAGLLPTQSLAEQVRKLETAPTSDFDLRRQVTKATALHHQIDDFIVKQIEAFPSISGSQLQAQLLKIFCPSGATGICDDGVQFVKVFVEEGWGPKTLRRQFVVASQIQNGFMGPEGSLVTIDSYLWDSNTQKARLTSEGGREFNGRTVDFLLLAWYPDASQYWIFVSGPPLGWSGRTYAGQATLYGVGTDSVTTIWKSGSLPDLKIQLNEMGWEASYDDSSRFYNNLPAPAVFDSYKFDYVTHHFQRVIHYRY